VYLPRRTWSPPGATCSPISSLGDEGDAAAFNRGLWKGAIRTGESGALDVARVIVDTTVRPKNIIFLTDA